MVMMKTMPYNKNITAAAAFNNNNNCLERKLLKATVLLVFSLLPHTASTALECCIEHWNAQYNTQHNPTQHNTMRHKKM